MHTTTIHHSLFTDFDIELFRKFNKKYKNLDEIICITDYHFLFHLNKNLIGSNLVANNEIEKGKKLIFLSFLFMKI